MGAAHTTGAVCAPALVGAVSASFSVTIGNYTSSPFTAFPVPLPPLHVEVAMCTMLGFDIDNTLAWVEVRI